MHLIDHNRDFEIAGIVIFTETGNTARALSRFRPNMPIIALTQNDKVRDQLCLAYGITSFLMDFPDGDIVSVDPIIANLKDRGLVASGQRLLFIHGHRWNEPGLTNTLSLKEVV